MNALIVGSPTGTALAVARRLADGIGPITLTDSDTPGLLAALDEPGMAGVDVLWADAADQVACDQAVMHRQSVYGAPDALVLVVDAAGDFPLGVELARRLPEVPCVLTGSAAHAVAGEVRQLRIELGSKTPWALVCGTDASRTEQRIAELQADLASRPAPPVAARAFHGCAH